MFASVAAGPIRRMEMDRVFGNLWLEAFISLDGEKRHMAESVV